jgi:transposase
MHEKASLEKMVQNLEAEILIRLKDNEAFRHLLTVSGMGPMTAAVIWSAIGVPSRFKTEKQVGRYARLDPSVMQSGQMDRRGRISRNESRQLRTALVEAAHTLGRFDLGTLGIFYRLEAATKRKATSAVALARKILVVAWRMMLLGKDDRAMKPERLKAKLRQVERRMAQRPDWDPLAAQGFAPSPGKAKGGSGRRLRKAG